MKKQLRKIALAVVFAMTVAIAAPAGKVALAAAKTFTYAEQKTGEKVTVLYMDRGEKVDLKFIGVSDYKNYKLKWVSSDEKVAVVDSSGMITALGNGTATVRLSVGDGKDYSSVGVIVYVGKTQSVNIGTAAKSEIKSYTLGMGQSVTLKANGLADNVGGRYICTWTSTDTSVAKINSNGVVTPVAPGLTVIQLTVKKAFSGAVMTAMPVALQVTANGAVTPVATATPVPTQAPGVTVTPLPTQVPGVTAVPTPTPIVETGNYSVSVTTDKSITLTFPNKVDYTVSDLELSIVIEASNGDFLSKMDISSVELDEAGKKMTITTVDRLTTSRYNIKVGGETQGKTFPVTIGIPTRMVLSYNCLGRENTAYAYDDEIGIDVPVNLVCRLYSGSVDVTESYLESGTLMYELVSPADSDDVYMEDDQVFFYKANKAAVVRGTYTYYNEKAEEKEIKDTVSIVSKEVGDYTVTHVANWTIIDDNDSSAIDWNNPIKKVVAGKENYKVVALLADSYGYYYSTDERGVDKSKNIYSIDDEDTLFAFKGYSYAFNTFNDDYFYVDSELGELYCYKDKQNATVYFTLYNEDEWMTGERNIGAWQFAILEESKLNKVEIKESSITLLTQAYTNTNNDDITEKNEERFCAADVVVTLYDQYNEKWTGDSSLEVSSNTSVVNDDIDIVASLDEGDMDGEWILHVDALALASLTTKSKVSLTVKDTDTKKSDSITVQTKNPASASKGIVVDDWEVGMKNATITFGEGDLTEVDAKAEVEIYQISQTGNYKVGLITNGNVDEKDNINIIKYQSTKTPSWDKAKAGEIYVLVLGPDKSVVPEAESEDELGVWIDAYGNISVNLTEADNKNLSCMKEGTYTVKITRINKDGGSSKTPKQTTFTLVDNTKDVVFAGLKSARTELSASDIEEIIVELCNFRLGGSTWTTLTENMITNVVYEERKNNKIYITSVEFAVPADGKSETGVVTYKKIVDIKKQVIVDVDD